MEAQTLAEPAILRILSAALAAWEYLVLFPEEIQIMKGKSLKNRPSGPELLALVLRQNLLTTALTTMASIDTSKGHKTRASCIMVSFGAYSSPFFVQVARTGAMIYLALLFQSRTLPSKAAKIAVYIALGAAAGSQVVLAAGWAFWLQPGLAATLAPMAKDGACIPPPHHVQPSRELVRQVLISSNASSIVFDLVCLACIASPLFRIEGARAKLSALWPGRPHAVFSFLLVLALHILGTVISITPKVWPYSLTVVLQGVLIARVLLNELALQRRIKNYKLRSPSEASAPSPNVFSNITSPFMTPDPAVKA